MRQKNVSERLSEREKVQTMMFLLFLSRLLFGSQYSLLLSVHSPGRISFRKSREREREKREIALIHSQDLLIRALDSCLVHPFLGMGQQGKGKGSD